MVTLETQQSQVLPVAVQWNCKHNSLSFYIPSSSLTQSCKETRGIWPAKLPENMELSFWIVFLWNNSSMAFGFIRGGSEEK